MDNIRFKLKKVEEFQKVLKRILEIGKLEKIGGICWATFCYIVAHPHEFQHLNGMAVYTFISAIIDDNAFNTGIEAPGVFGPLRQTLIAFLISIPPEDLLELIEAPRVFT